MHYLFNYFMETLHNSIIIIIIIIISFIIIIIIIIIIINDDCYWLFNSWSRVLLAVQKSCTRNCIIKQGVGENYLTHARLKLFSAGKLVLHRHDSR
jgi:hypothetical protein